MRRRLLNLATALSLLLFFGVATLGLRSHWSYDAVAVRWNPTPARPTSGGHFVHLMSSPGHLNVYHLGVTGADAGFWRGMLPLGGAWSHTLGGDGPAVEVSGLHYGRRSSWPERSFQFTRTGQAPCVQDGGTAARVVKSKVVAPLWSIMLLASALRSFSGLKNQALRWIEGCAGYVRLWKFDEVYRFNDPSHPFNPMGVEVVVRRKSEPAEWHRSHPKAQEQFFGATLWRQETRFPDRHISAWYVSIPCSMLLAALLILPISRLGFRLNLAYRRAVRSRSGRCPGCGYDLRATPGRCPECGTFAPTPPRPGSGRAGLKPWPKLFHNLRSTRQTEPAES